MHPIPVDLTDQFDLDPLGCSGFELDRAKTVLIIELSADGFNGTAAFNVKDNVVVTDRDNVPDKMIFRGRGGDDRLALTLGIELRAGAPNCTYLEVAADGAPVCSKHLKSIRIETLVTQIVVACASKHVVITPQGLKVFEPEITPDDVRAVERIQRRRRDPRTDRPLLERVAELYRQHPDAPNQAVAAEFQVSPRTAARWAAHCSDADLLPQVTKQGQKRL